MPKTKLQEVVFTILIVDDENSLFIDHGGLLLLKFIVKISFFACKSGQVSISYRMMGKIETFAVNITLK